MCLCVCVCVCVGGGGYVLLLTVSRRSHCIVSWFVRGGGGIKIGDCFKILAGPPPDT